MFCIHKELPDRSWFERKNLYIKRIKAENLIIPDVDRYLMFLKFSALQGARARWC